MAKKSLKSAVKSEVVETEIKSEVVETEIKSEVVETEPTLDEDYFEDELKDKLNELEQSNSSTSLISMLMTEVKPAEVVEVVEVKVVKNEGVGAFVRKLIAEGLTNTAILKIVHEQYGNKNTTYACVAWYRNKVKKTQAVATTVKATKHVEKFMEEPILDEIEEEVLSTKDLLQQVG